MSSKKTEITRLFGTSGIRGVVGKDLTYELLWNVGRAIAASLRPSANVLIATDSRESHDFVKAAVSMGLLVLISSMPVFYLHRFLPSLQ
jgi:phosphoglucosamine mutase